MCVVVISKSREELISSLDFYYYLIDKWGLMFLVIPYRTNHL